MACELHQRKAKQIFKVQSQFDKGFKINRISDMGMMKSIFIEARDEEERL